MQASHCHDHIPARIPHIKVFLHADTHALRRYQPFSSPARAASASSAALDLGISAAFGIAANIVGRVSETSAIESFGRQPKKPKARPA